MKYASDIVGLPVVSHATGERIHEVKDLLYDESQHNVLGLLVEEGGWLSKALAVPFSAITSIGADAVIIPSKDAVVEAAADERMSAASRRTVAVKGKQVMSEDGKDLGRIADLVVDETSGRVDGYLISGGIFADVYKGQPFIPAPLMLQVGEDVVFVPAEAVRELEDQAAGLRGAAQGAGEKLLHAGQAMSEKAQEGSERVGELYREKTGEWKAHSRGEELAATAKDRTESMKEGLDEFWDDVKGKASALKGEVTNRVEEERIKRAIGRTVNRVILAPGDEVVLQAGDVITWEAIDRARSAGVLDMILSSVNQQGPPPPPTMRRDNFRPVGQP
jgi:uncharacterized protein YrrD